MSESIHNELSSYKKKIQIRSKIENENKTNLNKSKVKKDYLVSILVKRLILYNSAKNLIDSICAM